MVKRKKNTKTKTKGNLSKIASFTAQSISSAYSSYKKNQEQKKIEEIKLRKLEENNKLVKEKKELKIREDQLKKDLEKFKSKEEDLKDKERELKSKEDKIKTEHERLVKREEDQALFNKEVTKFMGGIL